ncbi:glucosyltransferase domain-containing protein [Hyella patelloides]|nr:glucosyltransferase domain-containing protein [Hyella patelloides]
MSSLLLANILYSDDLTRVTTGETFWNDNGRPLSSLISLVLQLGKPLTDISPLPQVLAFAIYSLSAVYLGKLFKVHDLLLLTLSGVIFVINPFNLQNFAFVFDSFTMAVAILTSTLAALSISVSVNDQFNRKEKIINFSLSLLLLVCSLCLYQASTSVYLVTCFFDALVKLLRRQNKKSFNVFITSIIILLFSFIAYSPIKNFYITNEYNLHHSQLISFSDFPQKVIKNVLSSWDNIQQSLGNGTLINLFYILFVTTILTIIINTVISQKNKNSNSKSLLQYLLFLTFPVFYILLLIIGVSGVMLVLENPIFAPRTMMGFSTLVAICCLFLSNKVLQRTQKYLKYCLISFLFILSLAFSNVSFTLGNVLYSQNVQDEIIVTILISDLGEIVPKLPISQQHPTLAIVNALNYTYGNIQAYKKYPILNRITWYYLNSNQIQFYTKLETLGFKFASPDYQKDIFTGVDNQFIPKTEAVLIRPLYRIYFENNNLLVVVLQNPNS